MGEGVPDAEGLGAVVIRDVRFWELRANPAATLAALAAGIRRRGNTFHHVRYQ